MRAKRRLSGVDALHSRSYSRVAKLRAIITTENKFPGDEPGVPSRIRKAETQRRRKRLNSLSKVSGRQTFCVTPGVKSGTPSRALSEKSSIPKDARGKRD